MGREARKDYWFRPRRYGYGAAPATWQGWAAIIAFPVICGLMALALFAFVTPSVLSFIIFAIFMPASVFAFIALVRKKTDGEWSWQWGEDRSFKG